MGDHSSPRSCRQSLALHVFLRIIAFSTTLAAAFIMRLNFQQTSIGAYELSASYQTSPAFEFFVIGNAIAAAYLMITTPFISKLVNGLVLGVFDLLILSLCVAATSAHIAISWVGKFGNDETGWAKVCDYFEKFCDRTSVAIGVGVVGTIALLFISVLTVIARK